MADSTPESAISFRKFLEAVPPGKMTIIRNLGGQKTYSAAGRIFAALMMPEITLHCETDDTCGGNRLFQTGFSADFSKDQSKHIFLEYTCKNCSKSSKMFALWICLNDDMTTGRCFKFGEEPAFGPPTPARVISLIGPDRDLYLKGRRAENQGMGIAAFAYYRRVIENQKDRILDEIVKVCKRLSAGQPIIEELTTAKTETQFSKAVSSIKLGIPQTLLINGHNPLMLLHSALSEGIHAQTDEECLEIATSIRLVMADFAERMGQALKDEAELSSAVSRLINKKSTTKKESPENSIPLLSSGDQD